MVIKTLDDVLEELANKIGVYGCCKPAENEENCGSENGFCCRTGFMMHYEDEIRKAIENENKLKNVNFSV